MPKELLAYARSATDCAQQARPMEVQMKRRLHRIFAAVLVAALLTGSMPALADTTATVTADSLAVYTTPSLATAQVAGTIRKGTEVTVRDVSNGLAKITIKGRNYYVDASKLSIEDYIGEAAPVNPAQTAAPTAKPSATQKPADNTAKPVSPSGQTATITAAKLTIFKKPSKSAEKWGYARKGAEVTVLATSGSWAAINIGGKLGYCAYAGLSVYPKQEETAPSQPNVEPTKAPENTGNTGKDEYLVNGKGLCIALDNLKMYKKPNTFDGAYGTFKSGAKLDVTAVSGEWAKIVYKGKTGYVLRKGLRPATTDDGASSENVGSTTGFTHQTVTTTNLYQKPTTSSTVMKTISTGTKVYVKATSGGWAKVVYSGVNCYAKEDSLIEINDRVDGLVIVAQAKLYEKPNLAASVLGNAAEGATIDIYGVSNGWAKVIYNNQRAYVQESSLYVGKAAYSQLKSGDSGTNVQALQNRLETLGYFDGVPAGNYGSITVAAVKRFQQQKGLNVTGVANNATQAALYAKNAQESDLFARTLTNGSSGEYVTRLQTRLLYKNYYRDSVDGDYGADTVAAVKAFQKKVGITETGTADPATLRALFAPGAPKGENVRPAGSNGTPSLDPPDVTSDNEDIETVIQHALAQLGKPYVYGTQGPDSFDCSGLTYYCFKKVGITLPRTARDVGYSTALGERIPYDELQRGDIVCFNTMSDSDLSDHVGIYLGDGKFIHAPHTGSDVIVASMASGYYVRNFSWARRVIK